MERHRFFSFYPRNGILYVRFRPKDCKTWTSGQSTGFTDRAEAEFAVRAYLEGLRSTFTKVVPSTPTTNPEDRFAFARFFELLSTLPFDADHLKRIEHTLSERDLSAQPKATYPDLIEFLEGFWDYDSSPYVQSQLAKGHRISRRHCYDQTKHVQNHWKRFFVGRSADNVSLGDLETFALDLKERGLMGKTINNVTNAGVVALGWAFERGMIPNNPTQGMGKFAANSKARGVLTPDEVRQLFALDWPDERAKLGNLLACTCGLRSGEVRSLMVKDLEGEDSRTFIARAWNRKDLFTDPKWGSFRDASIPESIRKGLLAVAKESPFPYSPDLLVFHGTIVDRPRDSAYLLDSLKTMLLALNPDPNYWKGRRVDFHSWRHYFTSRMAELLDEPTLMKATGHKTKDAFDEYAKHMTPEQFEQVRTAQTLIFGQVVQAKVVANPLGESGDLNLDSFAS